MKKYVMFVSVFLLSFILLGFDANTASALSPGCSAGDNFSRTTGQACVTSVAIECYPGDIFSSVTGQRCSDGTTTVIAPVLIRQNIVVTSSTDENDQAQGSFEFNIYSPADDIQIYRTFPERSVNIIFAGNNVGPFDADLVATSPSSGTDNSQYFTVKKGETRTFKLSFVIKPENGSGYYKAQATSLYTFAKGTEINFGSEFTTTNVYLRGNTTLPDGCTSTSVYSMTTGQRCDGTNPIVSDKLIITEPVQGWGGWIAGTAYAIRWTNVQDPHVPKIFVSMTKPNGTGRINITNQADGYFPYLGDGMYADPQVKIPDNISSGSYKIFLTNRAGGTQQLSNVVNVKISAVTPTPIVSCSNLQSSSASSYFNSCRNQGYNKVCFNKNNSVYQGCGTSSYNDCTVNNTNASQNIWCDSGTVATPVISGVSGPQSLNVNQTGTWTVSASSVASGGNLSYSVRWGDVVASTGSGNTFDTTRVQTSTFTHSYSRAGNYAPVFTVTNEKGQIAQTSLSVNVGNTTTPSVTFISQNISVISGETTDQAQGAFRFNVYSPSSDIQIYRTAVDKYVRAIFAGTGITSSGSGYYAESATLTATTGSSGSDSSQYFTVKEGETRSFVLSFVIAPTRGSGLYRAQATSLVVNINNDKGGINFGSEFTTTNVYLRGNTVTPTRGVDLKVNGSSNPATVAYNSIIEVGWGTTGLNINETECSASGHYLPRVDGGLWNDLHNLSANGIERLYAKHNTFGYISPLQISIQCSDDGGVAVNDTVSIPVSQTSQPSITVISPNGGETWQSGSTQTIIFESSGFRNAGQYGAPLQVTLTRPSTGWEWGLGTSTANDSKQKINVNISSSAAVGGGYKVRIDSCDNANFCVQDVSDRSFTITSATSTNHPPTIVGLPGIQTNIQAGQMVNFSLSASDADNDDLAWGVDWGSAGGVSDACSSTHRQTGAGWNYNISHAWAMTGTYQVKFTVSDCAGGSDTYQLSVTVGSSVDTARKAAIYSYYQSYLARTPDTDGYKFWYDSTKTLSEIKDGILASTEYKNRRTSINQLYVSLLKREADTAGLDYWANNGLTLGDIKSGIYSSYEYGVKKQITDLYVSLLNRQPDDAGLDYWYGKVYTNGWTISQVSDGIKASAEYQNLHPVSSSLGASAIYAFPIGCSGIDGYNAISGRSCSGR